MSPGRKLRKKTRIRGVFPMNRCCTFWTLLILSLLVLQIPLPDEPVQAREADPIHHMEGSAEELTSGPMFFMENMGQIGTPDILFYSVGGPVSIGFGTDGIRVKVEYGDRGFAYDVEFTGSRSVLPVGSGEIGTASNFFTGSDPDLWLTDLPGYETITYPGVWEGIDIVYRIRDGSLKYDIIVHPGGDVKDIILSFHGIETDLENGEVIARTPLGNVKENAPYSYQYDGQEVDSQWKEITKGSYGYTVGRYDRSRDLVIDPGLKYSSYSGGSSLDRARSMIVDPSGYMYITGYTASNGFPSTTGAYDTSFNGGSNGDVFIMKVNISGDRLIYSTYLGGNGNDYGYSIVVDTSGNAFVGGQTYSTNFPTQSAYDSVYGQTGDGFITKLSSAGNNLVYSTYLGGFYEDSINDIKVDPYGNVYATGYSEFVNNGWPEQYKYPTTTNAYDRTYHGGDDVVVTKLSSNGQSLLFSTLIGHSSDDRGSSIDIDSSGNSYVTGTTLSSSFPTISGSYDTSYGGNSDCFVLRVASNGRSLGYSTFLGGSGPDEPYSLILDDSNNAMVSGSTSSSNFPTTANAYDTGYNSGTDGFISVISSSGTNLINSTFLGGTGEDVIRSMALNSSGTLLVTGHTFSSNFPTTTDAYSTSKDTGSDVFVTKIDIGGTGLVYSSFIGGSNNDEGHGIQEDPLGFIYLAGQTDSNDYPTSFTAFDRTHNSNDDVFFTKFYPADFAPTDLTSRSGYFFVELSWKAPTTAIALQYGIAGYTIYRGITSSDLLPIATVGPVTSYNDTIRFFISRTYHYFVSTILNTLGEGSASSMISDTPLVTPPPADPVPVPGDLFVNLTWTTMDPGLLDMFEVRYMVYKGLTPSYLPLGAVLGETDHYNDSGLPPVPRTYYYRVSYVITGIGESNSSKIVGADPNTPPGEPENTAAVPGNLNVTLDWDPPLRDGGQPVTGYRVYRGRSPGTLKLLRSIEPGVTKTLEEDLEPGGFYFYAFTAVNRLGGSLMTEPVMVTGQTRPSPPASFSAVGGDGNVVLGWGPPEDDWGVPLLGYNLYRGEEPEDLSFLKTLGPSTFTHRDSTDNGVSYFYTITAVNIHGESGGTGPIETMPTGIPGMVAGGSASIDDSTVTLRWGDPVHNGGLPLTAFRVYRGPDLDVVDSEFLLSSNAHSFVDTGLENGVTYYYRISALNAKGEGQPSSAVIATPGRFPARIDDLRVSPGLENAVLTWENPTDLGGRDGLNIRIYRGNTIDSMRPYETLPYGTDHYKDTSLVPGLAYYYSMSVLNGLGEGERSLIVSTVVYGAPSGPTIERVTPGSRQVNVSWYAPDDTGGLPVTGYQAQIRPEGEAEWESHITKDRFHLFTALVPGQTYAFQVKALNAVSEGMASRTVKVLVGDPPEQPRELKALALETGSAVRLSWTPRPLTSMPILSYRIHMGMSGTDPSLVAEVGSTVETYTVSGLLNGVLYNFSVSAVNQIGEGARTEEETAVPMSVPGQIDVIWVESVSDRSVKISWEPPMDNGGSPILDYIIRRGLSQGAEVNIKEGVTSTTYLDTDLDNGRSYYYKVVATNIMGSSKPGEWVSARPVGRPSPPVGFDHSVETDRIMLSWEPPVNNGGDPITGYLLYRSEGSGESELHAVLAPDVTMFTDRSVEEGSYSYRLIATNPNGMGEASVMNVDVPGRTNQIMVIGAVALLIPVLLALLVLFLPGFLRRRREKSEIKRKEREEEELKLRRMRAEGMASKGAGPMGLGAAPGMSTLPGGSGIPSISAAQTQGELPPSQEFGKDEGYIRPSDRKKKKRDRNKVLRADGRSLEHRMKEEDLRHTLRAKDQDRGREWEEEKKKILEKEARTVFTGQQMDEEEARDDLEPEERPVPTVEDVMKEVPEWDEDQEEDIPDWGAEEWKDEIPLADEPSEPEIIDEIEEFDELEEFDEFEE